MTTFTLIFVSPDGRIDPTVFLDRLPFRYAKPEYCNFGNPTRYYALPAGNFLQVEIWSTDLASLYKRDYYHTCLVLWQKSVPGSEEKAQTIWKNLSPDKRVLLEIFQGETRPSPTAISVQDSRECARAVMELIFVLEESTL